MVIVAIIRAFQDAMSKALLEAACQAPDASAAEELVAIHGAHVQAIERSLGLPAGVLPRLDGPVATEWIAAVRRAGTTAAAP
jgi:hypothetical protein